MKRLLPLAVLAVVFAVVFGGCTPAKVSELGQRPEEKGISEEQSRMLQEILEYQKKGGQDLAQMLDDLKAQKAAEAAAKGPHPLVTDLAVAEQLTAEAQKTDDVKELTSLLHRLQFVLMSMVAEAPSGTIVKRLERARLELTLERPSAEDASRASKELMAALDSCLGVEPAELVPAVLTRLEAAKKKLDQGDANGARQLIAEAQEQATSHTLNGILRQAMAAARGAEEAVNRGAKGVVKAELEELAAMLEKVAAVAVIRTEEPAAETEAAETTPTPAETPEPAAPPAATGAAVPEQPTTPAGSTPTPQVPPPARGGSTSAPVTR